MTAERDLIQRMARELDLCRQLLMDDLRETHALANEARAYLAQPKPEGPTDEEIMQLMPQQMHEDLAAAARALAEQASTVSASATGIMRIILNRHAVDLARAVLTRWGK
jgi:hypothetical protein